VTLGFIYYRQGRQQRLIDSIATPRVFGAASGTIGLA